MTAEQLRELEARAKLSVSARGPVPSQELKKLLEGLTNAELKAIVAFGDELKRIEREEGPKAADKAYDDMMAAL